MMMYIKIGKLNDDDDRAIVTIVCKRKKIQVFEFQM